MENSGPRWTESLAIISFFMAVCVNAQSWIICYALVFTTHIWCSVIRFFSLQVLKVQSELHDMKTILTSIACTDYGGSNQKEGGGRAVFVTSLEKLRFVWFTFYYWLEWKMIFRHWKWFGYTIMPSKIVRKYVNGGGVIPRCCFPCKSALHLPEAPLIGGSNELKKEILSCSFTKQKHTFLIHIDISGRKFTFFPLRVRKPSSLALKTFSEHFKLIEFLMEWLYAWIAYYFKAWPKK